VSDCVRVFIACSLDGFIAGPDDDLSWLPQLESDPSGEDYGYTAFIESTGAILMGRRSYNIVAALDRWPYGDTPVFVATSRPLEPVTTMVTALAGTAHELLADVRASIDGSIYLDGGALIRSFIEDDLVDEMTVTVVPVILGGGSPLFGGTSKRKALRLLSANSYPNGLVQLRYAPA
jgi:dihydrofolate reductase